MPLLKLKNASPVTIHGKRAGEVFTIVVDDDGVPLDLVWRKRLRDEARLRLGHIVPVVADAGAAPPAAAAAPVGDAAPAPAQPSASRRSKASATPVSLPAAGLEKE